MATISEYIAKHGEQDLFDHGTEWIGRDDDGTLHVFLATENGWAHRRPYKGSLTELRPVSIVNALGTGYPKWERPLAN